MTDQERIAELESTLKLLWGAVVEAYLQGDPTQDPQSKVFLKVDRELRRLGILQKVTA